MRAAGARVGLTIDGRARQVTTGADLDGYDLILAMDRSNLHRLQDLAPELSDRLHLFRSFDSQADHDEVPDPYGRPDFAYDETIRIVRSAAAGFLDSLQSD